MAKGSKSGKKPGKKAGGFGFSGYSRVPVVFPADEIHIMQRHRAVLALAPALFVRDSDSSKAVTAVFVRDSDSWKELTGGFTRDSDTWGEWF